MRAKSRRHHAHDGRIEVVHLDLPADDLLIAAEPSLPEFVTDHHVPDLAYFIRQAPQEWLNAKQWEESFGDSGAADLFHRLARKARVVRHNHLKALEEFAALAE